MTLYRPIILLTSLLLSAMIGTLAQRQPHAAGTVVAHTDSVQINFAQSKWDLDLSVGDNAAALDSIDRRLTTVLNDSLFRLRHVSIFGGASPEGTVKFNKFLSEHRAETLFGWFDKYNQLSDLDKSFTFYGRDWEGVLTLAEKDPDIPYRDEKITLLQTIVAEKKALNGEDPKRSLERMKQLRGSEPYRYLYKHIFPTVRASKMVIDYERILAPDIVSVITDTIYEVDTITIDEIVYVTDTIYNCPEKPFYMDLRSNMLYDVLALPNAGVEFYLGKNFTLGANWLYGWWKTDKRHRYLRAYGGEIIGRWWFGSAAIEKPFTGHHLGAYGQIYTYDFEWGGEGEMGGKPGGSLWDRCLWGIGVEYGYSLTIARHLNIDFSLGIGYSAGQYHKYKPMDDHYVWQSTHRRRYFGSTKLEVALVWLVGHGNINKKKGGEK